jgi:hypothetical protein
MTINTPNGSSTYTVSGVSLGSALKTVGGAIQAGDATYYPNGTVIVTQQGAPQVINTTIIGPDGSGVNGTTYSYPPSNTTIYYPNSTITFQNNDNFYTQENGTDIISTLAPYEQVLSENPAGNCQEVTDLFNAKNQKTIDDLSSRWQLGNRSFPIFTADYGLYWFDYQSGYDMVLAELGWNNSVAQQIGLARGAANLQGKSWGTIITWKYMQQPYLPSGDEMFDDLNASYECGAQYSIVFNYASDMNGTYGTLQDEHFAALQRFWSEVVQNSSVTRGAVKAEAALVLPKDYGWGLRHPSDSIWGIWQPDNKSQQVWTILQAGLAKYGTKLDVVYDDSAFPAAGRYKQVYYWNQTI